jgi:HD superfamily phosphohydrolase
MNGPLEIPELAALDAPPSLIRIPPETDVPVTVRVRRLIDTAAFRRMAKISQLGLVSLVYPGATHTRFEHSLGVYRLALLFLRQLSRDEAFTSRVGPADCERFLAAALLHDVGHWPFCHPIEDMDLEGIPEHESLARALMEGGEIGDVLRGDWGIDPASVADLLCGPVRTPQDRILRSLLSGPIDIDKMDYLSRDSLHAGVPYGRHFDQGRLISSLCLNRTSDALAIRDKGKTAAELLIFARYVMFSEVYWHHAVRGATAMLQRAFFLLRPQLELDRYFSCSDSDGIGLLLSTAGRSAAGDLLGGLFAAHRQLFKRWAQFSIFEDREMYDRLARRPGPWLAECSGELACLASGALGETVQSHEVLFDAPPVRREVPFEVDVYLSKSGVYRQLSELSPITRTLAQEQFDDYVKRVRVFVHPRLAGRLQRLSDVTGLVRESIRRTEERVSG